MKRTIMVVDDAARHRKLYADTLRQAGFDPLTAASADEALNLMAEKTPDMVVSDVKMPGMDGLAFLKKVRETKPELPFLLVTAYADVTDAVNALKIGAVDYLEKPIDLEELVAAVSDNLRVDPTGGEADLPSELMRNLVAVSPATRALFRDAHKVAESRVNVLLHGPSGVGKDVLARFIHDAAGDPSAPFVALNCAALPENLLGSELFGHEKGAFTGAVGKRKGRLREAENGTLFLDEIGDMPLSLQPSLLRAIETGAVTPIGSDKEVRVDFRLIAASHKDLSEEVQAGRFREDLFYRLNVIAFEIPPLRERREDIVPLAKHFLSERGGGGKRFSQSATRLLEAHPWPGNIRELANAIERARILSNTEVILPEHLPPTIRKSAKTENATEPQDASPNVKTIQEAENEAIRSALKKTEGNRTKAAQLLGISRRALVYKLKQLDF